MMIKEISYRKIKAIDMDAFRADLESDLCQNPPTALTDQVTAYNSTMSSQLDKHAPNMKKKITVCSRVSWFNSEIKAAKLVCPIWRFGTDLEKNHT